MVEVHVHVFAVQEDVANTCTCSNYFQHTNTKNSVLPLLLPPVYRALHLAIIHNHQDVVLQLLDVLPQLPPTETPVVDCLNNLKQVRQRVCV